MRRHFRWDKKYLYWGVTAFCVIAAAILFYMALNYLPRDGYHAFTISKCAPAFDHLGYFLYAKELKERAAKIYAGA